MTRMCCPFCQEPLEVEHNETKREYMIYCPSRRCAVRPASNWHSDINRAIKKWHEEYGW